MEAALPMLSRSSVTLKTAAVPPALIPRTGYVWNFLFLTPSLSLPISSLPPIVQYMLWYLTLLPILIQTRVLVPLMYQRNHTGLSPTYLERYIHKTFCIGDCELYHTFVTCSWRTPSTRFSWRCCRSPATLLSRQSASSARTFNWGATNPSSLEASRKLA